MQIYKKIYNQGKMLVETETKIKEMRIIRLGC